MQFNEFDLMTFVRAVKNSRRQLLTAFAISSVVGLIVAFSIPKVYVSSISLVSESQEETKLGGSMASMASLAGLKLGGGKDAISPELYPDVVATNTFLVQLMQVPVQTVDGEKFPSFVEYVKKHNRTAWWNYPKNWVAGLMGKFKSDSRKGHLGGEGGGVNPEYLSVKEEAFVKLLRSSITCNVDDDTYVIAIDFRAQDPVVAKIMVDTVTAHLQQFITRYRTNKARGDLEYYRSLEREAWTKYEETRKAYAKFVDSHMDATLQSVVSERDKLENELQLDYNVYSNYKQQVLGAEAKVQERTPAFTVVECASVPLLAESPRKTFILIAFVFLGVMGTIGWIYICLFLGIGRFKQPKDSESIEIEKN